MAELTNDQVELAVSAIEKLQRSNMDAGSTVAIRDVVCAAAPFLKLPWDDPTAEEVRKATADYIGEEDVMCVPDHRQKNFLGIVRHFICRRNAAMEPKSVMPKGFEGWKILGSDGNLRDVTKKDISDAVYNLMSDYHAG